MPSLMGTRRSVTSSPIRGSREYYPSLSPAGPPLAKTMACGALPPPGWSTRCGGGPGLLWRRLTPAAKSGSQSVGCWVRWLAPGATMAADSGRHGDARLAGIRPIAAPAGTQPAAPHDGGRGAAAHQAEPAPDAFRRRYLRAD